jgi:hypothetical protein
MSFHPLMHWLTLLYVRLLTNLHMRFSAVKCAPRCFLPRTSGTVIPVLYVVAQPTTNPSWFLCVPHLLVRIDSEVDFQVAAWYLEIVEIESGSPRPSWHLSRVCNLCMRLVDSPVGAFAITSLPALFAVASLLYC